MASSDFDDIFGDLKEDQHAAPSLATGTSDFDDAAIFGDAPPSSATYKPATVDTPTSSSNAKGTQDEFLSWLDDGPPTAASTSAPAMGTIDLGDDDDFLGSAPSQDEPIGSHMGSAVAPLPPAIISVKTAPPPAPMTTTISLDDDDDDDLEKIVRDATAHARKSGSHESSGTSLHIKSQSHRHEHTAPQFDLVGLTQAFNATGTISTPAARLAMWHRALCSATKESISMYAVQTTPLDLPNQSVLRKDVETMSSVIFSSAVFAQSVAASGTSSDAVDVDGSRLLFIDNAEILVTYLCKKLRLSEYPLGFAFAFGPTMAVAGIDPLRVELIATIQSACHRLLPHLMKEIPPQEIADARRALLKWLLLYHAPTVAFHLDQHFHQWNTDTTIIPDTWLASMFESDNYRSGLDGLVPIWDACVLLDVASPSSLTCFVVIHLIAQAEKKLLRMEGDQLRLCMAQTLLETLQDKTAAPLALGVRSLIDATPPSMSVALRDAGLIKEPTPPPVDSASADAKDTKRFSLIAASTNGVMQVGSAVGSAVNTMVIDMPTKLLTTIVPIKFSASSTMGPSVKDQAASEAFFTQLMQESTPASSVCMTLAARDVVPVVFRSFQAALPQSDASIRYFIIDCRARDETQQGQIPTAFHFDPDAVTDPAVLDTVLATLNPLKSTVHLCVMGHGYGHIADDLRQLLATQPSSSDVPFFLQDEFLESFARDISRVNAAVLFLAKRGFPHVSVLEGGYAAAHTQLLHSASEGYSVADLIDHDAPKCSLCHHRRPSTSSAGSLSARTESARKNSGELGVADASSSQANRRSTMPAQQAGPKLGTSASTGDLDAKALFDGHTSPSGGGAYFSTFAGALKTGGKAMSMMNPANSMAGGSKWLMGMKTNSNPTSPVASSDAPTTRSSMTGSSSMTNLSKLKTSLTQIGSESLDMLKKAEQAAVKTTQLKGMFGSVSPSSAKAPTPPSGPLHSPSSMGAGTLPRSASFQRAEEEVFTIDDDEEEEQDDFVGSGRHSSRTSSSSSTAGHRTDSFAGSAAEAGMPSTVVLHTVEQGHVKDLTKGMRISRTQMLPFVESPFFSAYKKKASATSPASPTGRASMLPRRLVVADNHIIVLKAERSMDDVYCVKSCHHLSHLGRMTCLKKNALMVTMYYKWKAPHSGDVLEKKNAYEVQQRDEFIKVIKNAMEKM